MIARKIGELKKRYKDYPAKSIIKQRKELLIAAQVKN
jgi:hypothetical protein